MLNTYTVFAEASSDGITIILVVVGAVVLGGVLVIIVAGVAVWSGGSSIGPSAAAAVIRPSSYPVQVARRRRRSLDRTTREHLPRNGARLPRVWIEPSPDADSQTWNARQWYRPDAEIRLVPPGPPRSQPGRLPPSAAGASRHQNWYSPAYHGAASSQNSISRRRHYYYPRVNVPREQRTIRSFYTA